jgi:hypothetical protein
MGFSRFVMWAFVQLTCAIASAIFHVSACEGQIRVNELLADPGVDWNQDATVSSRDDEWFEIVNAGTTPVNIDNLRMSDGGTTRNLRFGFSGVLAPGAVRVVFGSESVAWEEANALGSAGLSLNNAGDEVRLWEVAGTDTILIDHYTYASFEVLNDRSTGRMPDGADTWHVFDALNPYSGTTPPLGTGCNPTPGQSNICATPVEPVSWGRVKRIYDSRRAPTP